jgi:hypothetical protein
MRTFVAAPVLVVPGVVVFPVGSLLSTIVIALAGIMLATSAVGWGRQAAFQSRSESAELLDEGTTGVNVTGRCM